MKKLYFILVFFAFFGVLALSAADEQEEIDYLLFMPNSSTAFTNDAKAAVQLDNLAKYLTDRNLSSAQIQVYGYAAAAANDIEPVALSRDRALFVISELQRRGVPKDLFADPVAYGEVNLWGSNANETDRIPNRRVRIVIDGTVVTQDTLKAAVPEVKAPVLETTVLDNAPKPAEQENTKTASGSNFPWIILILLILILLALLLLLLLKRRKNSKDTVKQETSQPVPSQVPPPAVAPLAAVPAAPLVVPPVSPPAADKIPEQPAPVIAAAAHEVKCIKVEKNLDLEIRRRAYELYQERNGQNGDADGDWYRAVSQIGARYEAEGYKIYTENGSWWAHRSYTGEEWPSVPC